MCLERKLLVCIGNLVSFPMLGKVAKMAALLPANQVEFIKLINEFEFKDKEKDCPSLEQTSPSISNFIESSSL